MSELGGAFLAAARAGKRGRARRGGFLAVSLMCHFAVVGVLVFARPRAEVPAPTPPEPVLLRFSPPRPARPPAPRPARPPSRPRPVMQPPPVAQPPPVEAPPPEPPAEPGVEEPQGDEPEAEVQPPPAPAGMTGVSGGGVHELREVARPPTVLEQVVPEYPRAARFDRIVGLVVLRVVVGMDGRVEPDRTVVVRSVPELDAAAIAAIGKWRFSPALGHAGRPVRVVMEVPFQFSLR